MDILTAVINGIEMDYFRFGTGSKTFVILPGLSLKSVMLSAPVIAGAYKSFKTDYTVYVFDRRKSVSDTYSVRQMADDTAEIMQAIGLHDVDIFGASQGGMMAQYMAIDYPQLVHSIILGSTCSRNNDKMIEIMNKWINLAEKHDVPNLNHSIFENIYSDGYLKKYEDVLPIVEKNGTAEECDRFVIFAKACIDFNSYDELDRISCPVLVLGSEKDKVLTAEGSTEIAEKIGCEIYMYQGYGHAVYDEAPDYKDRILSFLSRI